MWVPLIPLVRGPVIAIKRLIVSLLIHLCNFLDSKPFPLAQMWILSQGQPLVLPLIKNLISRPVIGNLNAPHPQPIDVNFDMPHLFVQILDLYSSWPLSWAGSKKPIEAPDEGTGTSSAILPSLIKEVSATFSQWFRNQASLLLNLTIYLQAQVPSSPSIFPFDINDYIVEGEMSCPWHLPRRKHSVGCN
jgi:hypothetical protein